MCSGRSARLDGHEEGIGKVWLRGCDIESTVWCMYALCIVAGDTFFSFHITSLFQLKSITLAHFCYAL